MRARSHGLDNLQIILWAVIGLGAIVAVEIVMLVRVYRRRRGDGDVEPSGRRGLRRKAPKVGPERRASRPDPSERREAFARVLIHRGADERTSIGAAIGVSEAASSATVRLVLHAVDEGRLPAFAAAAAVAQALPEIEPNIAALLVIGDLGPAALRVAIAAVGEGGGEASMEALLVRLSMEQSDEMRVVIARALLGAVVRGADVPEHACRRLLGDPADEVRSSGAFLAAAALGDRASTLLFPLLADRSSAVARAAATAICDLPSGPETVARFLDVPSAGQPLRARAQALLASEIAVRTPGGTTLVVAADEPGPEPSLAESA